MAIVYMDSFETQDGASRYVVGTVYTLSTIGRGTPATTALAYNGSFTTHVRRPVPALTVYGAAIATMTQATGLGLGVLQFVETSGTIMHVCVIYNAAGQIEVRRGNATGTLLGTSGVVRVDGSFRHIEAKVTIDATVGAVEVRVDETAVLTLTGQNTKNGGTGIIDQIWAGDGTTISGVRAFTAFDDFVIWDTSGSTNNTFVGDCRVEYQPANATGTYTDATASSGTTTSCVDDVANNGDTDFVSLVATGLPKATSFNITNALANVTSILAVQPIAIARKDDASANTGRLLLISGATESDAGADLTPGTSYTSFFRVHDVDPNTGSSWTISNFNAIEVGWRRTV